ncbi:beta-alanyl-bioamine nonribosomal peptide synthetase ebony-like [Glandiceps talaboti]
MQNEDQALVAYCKMTLDGKINCTTDYVINDLCSHLPDYMIPKIVCIDDFPVLPNAYILNNQAKTLGTMSIIRGPKLPPPYGLPANTVHGVLEHLVMSDESANQKTAILYDDKETTYGECNRHANALARVIKDRLKISNQGDHAPVCIGLHFDPSEIVVKLVVAVLKLGAAYLPLDPKYPVKRLQYTITDSSPCCVITPNKDGRFIEMMSDIPDEDKPVVLPVDDLMASMKAFPDSDLEESEQIISGCIDFSTLACVLYTSGSTGLPKGVLIPHRSILHRVSALWSSFPSTDSDVSCWKSSPCDVDSITEIFGSLLRGLIVAIPPAVTADNLAKMIATLNDKKVTWITLFPTTLHEMLTVLKESPGEQSRLANVWGMTETIADATIYNIGNDHSEVFIGQPLQNTNIYLLNDNMLPVPIGEIGLCYVSGPSIVDGYLEREKLENTPNGTKQMDKFIPNPFETDPDHRTLYNSGDYMRLILHETTNKLQLVFEGRQQDINKYHGFRSDLYEIESALCDLPYIDRVVALLHQDASQDNDHTLVAYYKTSRDTPDCTPESITEYLHAVLPCHVILRVVWLDEFPKHPNGKTDNNALYDIFRKSIGCK